LDDTAETGIRTYARFLREGVDRAEVFVLVFLGESRVGLGLTIKTDNIKRLHRQIPRDKHLFFRIRIDSFLYRTLSSSTQTNKDKSVLFTRSIEQ
jgi:hypothetical protein